MKIIVSKDIVKLNENHSENHYGEYNVNECVFEFDEYFDSVPIKKAIFTSQSNNKSFEIDIINNKCTVPHEVLTKVYDTVILGVYGYDVNEETLLVRYSPEPTTFVIHEGSYREGAEQPEIITPTQYDMFSKALQEGLAEVDERLDDVEKQGDYASEQGNYAKEQGDYAKSEGDNAKSVAEETEKKAQEGAFDGKSLEFVWEGTKLGVRLEGQEEYHFVDLQGKQGEIGATGEPFKIKKTYGSVSEMNSDFANMEFGDYVMIASSVDVEDNAKLYTRGENAWIFISDFSGAMGIRGETGLTPNIQIGTVQTLEAGSQASVTRSGTDENPLLNFAIPKGDKGDDYVLTEEDKVEIGEKVNTEYEKRIEENEKDIVDLETYLDTITPKSSAKGELVHITDALPLATFENKVDGNVEQETTTGRNLLPIVQKSTQTTYGITFASNGDGSYTISGTATSGVYITFNLPISVTLPSSTLYWHLRNNNVNSGVMLVLANSDDTTQSQPGLTEANRIMTSGNLSGMEATKIGVKVSTGTVVGTITLKPSIELTNDITPYEPYTEGQASPNPEFPKPIEVVEGYNLWDFENQKFVVGARCIVEQTKDYIKLTATETGYAFAVSNITLDAGDYIFDIFAGTNNYTSNFVTLKDNNAIGTSQLNGAMVVSLTEKTNITLRLYISNANVGDSITITKIFVTKRNFKTQSTYMPYNHIGIEVCGKNKAKSIVNIPSASQFIATLFIDTNYIKPSTTYTIGFVAPKDCKMYFNENLFKYVAITGTGKFETYTITTLDNIDFNQYFVSQGWLVLKINSGNTVESIITDVILVEGVVNDLTYEPFQEQIVPLDLKGNFIGKIKATDIEDNLYTTKKVYGVKKYVGKHVFDGSEGWGVDSSRPELIRFFATIKDLKISSTRIPILSNYYIYNNNYDTDYIGSCFAYDGNIYFYPTNDIKTIDGFKTLLKEKYDSGNPVEAYFPLAQPYTEELGELPEPIKTFEGVNNIQLLANLDTEIEVTYALDVKKYFENKLASIQEQIL